MRPSARTEAVFVPLQVGPDGTVAPVTQVRSTMLSASLLTIKDRGYFDAYRGHLPLEFHDPVLNCVAGT